jgi:predicted metalloprotease
MRYDENDRRSTNVEDRRGEPGGGGGGLGFPFPGGNGGIQIPMGSGRGGFSITWLLIIGAIMLFFGINPLDLLRGAGPNIGGIELPRSTDQRPVPQSQRSPFEIPGLPGQKQQRPAQPANDSGAVFIQQVLADTEDVWERIFKSMGKQYDAPKLVIFTGRTRTGCGVGQTAMGPFYCPLDQKVYIDLAFYEELRTRFKAPGDFAQAYVIAHEVGHHVQTILGIAEKVQELKQQNPRFANQIQVRMELQADCYAGVWANLNHQLKNRLQPGDIEEGLNAAAQIGDDRITQGRAPPESFTHGTSAQRVSWFKRGYDSGDMKQCDAFRASTP